MTDKISISKHPRVVHLLLLRFDIILSETNSHSTIHPEGSHRSASLLLLLNYKSFKVSFLSKQINRELKIQPFSSLRKNWATELQIACTKKRGQLDIEIKKQSIMDFHSSHFSLESIECRNYSHFDNKLQFFCLLLGR